MISAAMDFWMITFRNFEGPSASCGESQFCSKTTPVGLDAPTTARGWDLAYVFFFARRNRRGAGGNGGKYQPSGLSAEGGNDPEFRQTTSGAHGSAGRADCLPRGKPPACSSTRQLCCKKSPRRGLTRRLRRGWWGCRPEGGSTFFRRERKYQRKHAARRLREKALYCPFLKEGVRNVARKLVGKLTHAIVRARAHSFPLSKRARLFPYAAYRRSASPQLAWGRLNQCELG